jgi:hypothetical protein
VTRSGIKYQLDSRQEYLEDLRIALSLTLSHLWERGNGCDALRMRWVLAQ